MTAVIPGLGLDGKTWGGEEEGEIPGDGGRVSIWEDTLMPNPCGSIVLSGKRD